MAVPANLKYFNASEFHKDPSRADAELCRALDAVRAKAGIPIHVHVCFATDGHSSKSWHYQGKAVDFHFSAGLSLSRELSLLVLSPFGGIGFYPHWSPRPGWHVDMRPHPRLFWIGEKDGSYSYFNDVNDFKKAIGL